VGANFNRGALHASLKKPVGELTQIFDGSEGDDHCKLPYFDAISSSCVNRNGGRANPK
jgi:hypothetical protein